MYHNLVERSLGKVKNICHDIKKDYVNGNSDEIYLLNIMIHEAEGALKAKRYYALYSSLYPLGSDLRPWHNVPEKILKSLEDEVKELGDNIIVQHPDIRKPIKELQKNLRIIKKW